MSLFINTEKFKNGLNPWIEIVYSLLFSFIEEVKYIFWICLHRNEIPVTSFGF